MKKVTLEKMIGKYIIDNIGIPMINAKHQIVIKHTNDNKDIIKTHKLHNKTEYKYFIKPQLTHLIERDKALLDVTNNNQTLNDTLQVVKRVCNDIKRTKEQQRAKAKKTQKERKAKHKTQNKIISGLEKKYNVNNIKDLESIMNKEAQNNQN